MSIAQTSVVASSPVREGQTNISKECLDATPSPSKPSTIAVGSLTPPKRKNQKSPTVQEFIHDSPAHQLEIAPPQQGFKAPVYCGLCEKFFSAHKAWNAKYIIKSIVLPKSTAINCSSRCQAQCLLRARLVAAPVSAHGRMPPTPTPLPCLSDLFAVGAAWGALSMASRSEDQDRQGASRSYVRTTC